MKLLTAVLLTAYFAPLTFAEDKKPTKALQGEWKVVSFTVTAMDLPKEETDKMKVTVKDGILTLKSAKTEKSLDITLTLDPKAKPATVDLTWVEGGQEATVPGIYKVEKDKLTICYEHNSAGKRPKEFKSDDGGRTVLLVLERVKK